MNDTKKTAALGDLKGSLVPEIAVILVQPSDARNIGAVARAMSNLSVTDLRLVEPRNFDRELAREIGRGVACWGGELIDACRTFPTLEEAISDCNEVVGFASDSGKHRVSQLLLQDWISTLDEQPDKRVALVFGSEENGLLREHFPLCQHLVRIPSSSENPSYNLAQSVVLALFTIRTRTASYVGGTQPEWPTSNQLQAFTEMVVRVSENVGFLNENSPAHMIDLLINMTRRGRFTVRELRIMTGLFGTIERSLRR